MLTKLFGKTILARLVVAIAALCMATFLSLDIYSGDGKTLTVAFLDIGQGDAIFIEAPNGAQLLLDAGLNGRILEALDEVMPFYDRTLDAIMMSHPDADHIGGFPDVLAGYDVATIIRGSVFEMNDIVREIDLRAGSSTEQRWVEAGDRIVLDAEHNVYLDIFHPSDMFIDVDTNDASIVARLVYGDTEFMLTGDASTHIENYLVGAYGPALASDVLKAGHHGSKTSTSDAFLGMVKPTYVVISAGKDNSYGHPHQEVTDRLTQFGVEILNTAQQGTIIMKSDGKEIVVEK